ncbi:hypothetical protein MLD38_019527 [Melastoma candidum]|uniref:Uncharacterized protein n=1 Tax=Melastoma candidum TaxID=119954 RepID=A0ACB9QWE0_9MYRT|nr:hypothetical protein MLD38_019527 [Melastoma candidum]
MVGSIARKRSLQDMIEGTWRRTVEGASRVFVENKLSRVVLLLSVVSRSIRDAYLKRPEFSPDASFPRFHLAEPLRRPVLTAEPMLCSRTQNSKDKFVIFASDGLWEHISNQQAVEIVYNTPRAGIAQRLMKAAMKEAARKREMSFTDLKKVKRCTRRYFHDDITVVVLFLDHEMPVEKKCMVELSLRGFVGSVEPWSFDIFLRN